MRVVLVAADSLEQLHVAEVELAGWTGSHIVAGAQRLPLPAVVRWGSDVFVFAYRENSDSVVYRQSTELVLPRAPKITRP